MDAGSKPDEFPFQTEIVPFGEERTSRWAFEWRRRLDAPWPAGPIHVLQDGFETASRKRSTWTKKK